MLHLNRAPSEHNPTKHVNKSDADLRELARAAYRAAGGTERQFVGWWEHELPRFDNVRALVGAAWDAASGTTSPETDAAFVAWWASQC